MSGPLDKFMPCTRFALPDESVLTVGTITREDYLGKDVHITHADPSSPEPVLQLILPPHSIDQLIQALQQHANEARFVNGEPMMEYPEPISVEAIPKGKS